MTVVVQYKDEVRLHRIKNIKLVCLNGGLLDMIGLNGNYLGSINIDKCVIYRVEE